MRLIDADALKSSIAELKKSPWFNMKEGFLYRKEAIEAVETLCVDKEPTIDSIRYGRWVPHDCNGYKSIDCDMCSECGERFYQIAETGCEWKYCPSCGAKMDGGTSIDMESPSINFEQIKRFNVQELKRKDIEDITDSYIGHLIDDIMEKWRKNEGKLKIVFTYEGNEIQRIDLQGERRREE